MRYYITILLLLSTFVFSDSYCGGSCDRVINKEDLTFKNSLTCRLPAMPTFEISAPNVLESDGRLKRYFATNNTVCDVLGWMNHAAEYFSKVPGAQKANITEDITLSIKHLKGSKGGDSSGQGALILDSDHYIKTRGKESATKDDGNVFAYRVYDIVAHEFFHKLQSALFAKYQYQSFDDPYYDDNDAPANSFEWVDEGTARMFEDIVYDNENPYHLSRVRR